MISTQAFHLRRAQALGEKAPGLIVLAAVILVVLVLWDWFVDPSRLFASVAIRVPAGASMIILAGLVGRLRLAQLKVIVTGVSFLIAVFSSLVVISLLEDGLLLGTAGITALFIVAGLWGLRREVVMGLMALSLCGLGVALVVVQPGLIVSVNAAVFCLVAAIYATGVSDAVQSVQWRAYVLEEKLRWDAQTDSLTGVLNRRAVYEVAAREVSRSRRNKHAMTVLLMDIDHFKSINDSYGHDAGDQVLRSFASMCRRCTRDIDSIGRVGGEEFVVILPETELAEGAALARRICETSAGMPIATESGEVVSVTVSIGLSEIRGDSLSWEAALKEADAALYEAKQNGRNQVRISASAWARNKEKPLSVA